MGAAVGKRKWVLKMLAGANVGKNGPREPPRGGSTGEEFTGCPGNPPWGPGQFHLIGPNSYCRSGRILTRLDSLDRSLAQLGFRAEVASCVATLLIYRS